MWAYVALILGVATMATTILIPIPFFVGTVGLATAAYAWVLIRARNTRDGIGVTLFGAILSALGLLIAATIWLIMTLTGTTLR